jgi:hypothetical protein
LQGPLYQYSTRTFLMLAEWHGENSDLVRWIAKEILNAGQEEDRNLLNIEEYKFVENPKKDGVKTAFKPNNERKGYSLLLFKNIQSKNMGERAVRACGRPNPTNSVGRSALTHQAVETDQRAIYVRIFFIWEITLIPRK